MAKLIDSRMFTLLLLAALPLLLNGCFRARMLPTAENEDHTMAIAEPRFQDHLKVPLEKDPTKIYRLGARDVVRVDVRKDPTLTGEFTITEEGQILLPNIGPFKALDLTAAELEQKLNELLSQYIREPEVKVGIQQYNSKVIYVQGQVNSPGAKVMRADMLTLQEALIAANLPTDNAALSRAQVITPDINNKPEVRQIDLADILYKGRMSENILLKPNDIVYVPAKHSVSLGAMLRELISPVEQVYDLQYKMSFQDINNNNGNNNN